MQLLPQQSEIDENSLKKFPIYEDPSLDKACLKLLQPPVQRQRIPISYCGIGATPH